MRVDLFDFDLPEDRIALRPCVPRDAARLLHVATDGVIADRAVRDLPVLLRPGDIMVFNDTKVVPAQLFGIRERDGATAHVDATLHMRTAPDRWKAFMRPAKRLKTGDRIRFGHDAEARTLGALDATVLAKGEGGEAEFAFDLSGRALDEAIAIAGHIPLPPYIASKRSDDERDRTDYQTVFAREEGAVAAPTAGLHFTPELLAAIDAHGVHRVHVTLHVGAGTFLPVKAEDTRDHKMHGERGDVSADAADAINAARAAGGRVVAIGTTSLRLLESATDETGRVKDWTGTTGIFITPGYRFRAVDLLMTNFHLPRSTLFMLVSAFSGLDTMKAAYRHAIDKRYRFYSYGDACLLERAPA
jgi:S-adenosylmethionine:tRNA ribosyltransferase-isomerase